MSVSSVVVSLGFSAAGFVGGFVGGYLAGRVCRVISELGGTEHSRWWHMARTLFGLLLLVLVATSALASYRAVGDQRRVTECQAEYNINYARALTEQRAAAAFERKSQRDFLNSVFTNPAARAEAYAVYLGSLDAADRRRDDNPLPRATPCLP